MSFQQGLSGLNAASKSLEVIGNNVANASTVGFKQSQVVFADVYASSLAGGGASQVGIGTKLAQVAQQFTQGNLSTTNNPLDLSINGNGFFGVQNASGDVFYTRNGQFQLDAAGNIINSTGFQLRGYPIDATGEPDKTAPLQALQIPGGRVGATASRTIEIDMNLDARKDVADVSTGPAGPYHHMTTATVYDSLGNSHILQAYYLKTDTNEWEVHGVLNGDALTPSLLGNLNFDANGQLDPAADVVMSRNIAIVPANGANPLDISLSFGQRKVSQLSTAFTVDRIFDQEGRAPGELTGFGIGADGVVVGRYSNGATSKLGQIALTTFQNPNGLQAMGNNLWKDSPASGPALTDEPGLGTRGLLQASTVEESNVDLTAELVKMITAQRNYQANAQTIKTQDQAMQTLVNMR